MELKEKMVLNEVQLQQERLFSNQLLIKQNELNKKNIELKQKAENESKIEEQKTKKQKMSEAKGTPVAIRLLIGSTKNSFASIRTSLLKEFKLE